ncbi:hypothetical protein U6B65_14465 [Oscillospiraceae bacterium MB08-C2-2]|nr:hypothetical protein U6B65_14465 [Oscillospiraceae bacterium MB08-C2-2]
MDYTLGILLLPLACIGLVQIFGWMSGRLQRPRQPRRQSYYVIPVYSGKETLEQKLRYELFKIRWSLDSEIPYIILVDMGMDGETLDLCNRYMGDSPGFFLCVPHELENLLMQLDNLQIQQNRV